jgi:hypothetical protein
VCFLSPVLPSTTATAISPKKNCSAQMEFVSHGACRGCVTESSMSSGNTCCSAQCCALYFSRTGEFVSATTLIGRIGVTNQRVSRRAQRPPVPPPRTAFS